MTLTRRTVLRWITTVGGAAIGSRWIGASEAVLGATTEPAGTDAGAAAATLPVMTRWERSAQLKREMTKDVVWLTHEPLAFMLRRGGHSDDEAKHYEQMCDSANLKRIAAAGVRYSRVFFYKGFGLEFERASIEKSRAVADTMHQLGMKVSLYVGGTMFIETLDHELPQARGWEQRDAWNQPVTYGEQTFRHYPCPNEPAYRDYIKRILKIGVSELGAEQIAFDNVMLQPEPKSCRCARCLKGFTEFLRRNYPTREAAARRFGIDDLELLRPTEWDSPDQPSGITEINDPVLQEWTRFRCESLANYANDFHDYIKSLNPNVSVMYNVKGVYSFNRYWANAVYHPLFAGHMDALSFDTGGYDEHIDPGSGALISQIRSYKMARRLGVSCEDSMTDDVRGATHMAFGYQKPIPGWVGAPFGSGASGSFTPLLEFFREFNDRYYTETDNIADVAVLHTWASMAYSVNATYTPVTLIEQVLIQHKIPWDLLFEEQLEQRLNRYQAVILAGQECVSDAQAKMLMNYVRGGGSLIVTGNTAMFNERRERRHANALVPADRAKRSSGTQTWSEGKGKIVYIGQIAPAESRRAQPAGDQDPEPGIASNQQSSRLAPPQWVLPKNHEAIRDAIVAALVSGPSITCDAPLTTVMELLDRAGTNETIVHFVNFEPHRPLEPFAVSVRKLRPQSVKSVTVVSPDQDDPISLEFREAGDRVSFTVPTTRVYAMVVIA